MKQLKRSMRLLLVVSGFGMLYSGAVGAQGQPSYRTEVQKAQRTGPTTPYNSAGPTMSHKSAADPKVVSRTRQATGTPHKVSSFAPHPTSRRVFGAPIQAPIVTNRPAKKPNR